MDLLSLVPYTRDRPGSENCLTFPVLLGTLLGLSLSFKVGQTGSMPLNHPGMGLLSGWVCEQGRTQSLVVLKNIPKPHPVNKNVTFSVWDRRNLYFSKASY